MKLERAIMTLARRYRKLRERIEAGGHAGLSYDVMEAKALQTVVAQAIAIHELGIPTNRELLWIADQRLITHLGLYPPPDRNRKKALRKKTNPPG